MPDFERSGERLRVALADGYSDAPRFAGKDVEEVVRKRSGNRVRIQPDEARVNVGRHLYLRRAVMHSDHLCRDVRLRQADLVLACEKRGAALHFRARGVFQRRRRKTSGKHFPASQLLRAYAAYLAVEAALRVHPEVARIDRSTVERSHFYAYRPLEPLRRVVDHRDGKAVLVRDDLHRKRRKEVPCAVLQTLVVAVIVYRRPRTHGPAVVELPEQRTVAPVRIAPPEFRRVAHAFALAHLREIDVVAKLRRKVEA